MSQDYAEAVKWSRKAAEQGNALAQRNLGVAYNLGYGVLRDYVQAHKWFNLAASSGDSDSMGSRDRVASEMTRDQIAEAQRLARDWMEQHPQE